MLLADFVHICPWRVILSSRSKHFILIVFLVLTNKSILSSSSSSRNSNKDRASTSSSESVREEAIDRLSRVFEVEKVPKLVFRGNRSPPEYMTNLFQQVAYNDGISRSPSPYEADIVRGFPDRTNYHEMHFTFNLSSLIGGEHILEAEFHLFKMRPRSVQDNEQHSRVRRMQSHVVDLRLYQVLDEDQMYAEGGLQLMDQRRISAHQHGWQIFRVGDTVRQWINDSNTNLGFLVTATSLDGGFVNGSHVRFAQRGEHHDSKQPVLIAFTDKTKSQIMTSDSEEDDIIGQDGANSEMESVRRNYVQFLNEGFRAKHGGFPYRKMRNYMSPEMHQELTQQTSRTRSKRSLRSKKSKRSQSSPNYYRYGRRKKKSCQRQELYVDFDEIGWSGWIISPKGYNAYHCKGMCPFPLGQNQKPTNHATVQSIVHALRIGKDVEMPCCVPNKLYSISLLYFDDDENVILKQYDDMVAASCGCQ